MFMFIMTTDKYLRHKRYYFLQIVLIQPSQKLETFYKFFFVFLKSKSNSELFEKQDEPYSSSISKLLTPKKEVT